MPTEKLSNLPPGSDVFLDSNILIYALGGRSVECKQLLERCSREELSGITSFHVVGEVTHRLMCQEAQSLGFIREGNPTKQLQESPEIVRRLTSYWAEIERLLSFNLLFLSVDEAIVRAAQSVRTAAGLLNNDSIVVSCMKRFGIAYLASNDQGFDRVPDIFVFRPTDVT